MRDVGAVVGEGEEECIFVVDDLARDEVGERERTRSGRVAGLDLGVEGKEERITCLAKIEEVESSTGEWSLKLLYENGVGKWRVGCARKWDVWNLKVNEIACPIVMEI